MGMKLDKSLITSKETKLADIQGYFDVSVERAKLLYGITHEVLGIALDKKNPIQSVNYLKRRGNMIRINPSSNKLSVITNRARDK